MSHEEISQDLLKQISTSLESQKVDTHMKHLFDILKNKNDFDPTISSVGFLARVSSESTKLNYVLSKIGNIFGVYSPWSSIPDFVSNKEVISIEASR